MNEVIQTEEGVILLPDEARPDMPPTRPDSESRDHKTSCMCEPCQRPGALEQKHRQARADRKKLLSSGT